MGDVSEEEETVEVEEGAKPEEEGVEENLIRFIVFSTNIKSILFLFFLFPNYVYRFLRSFFILFLTSIIIFERASFFIIIKIMPFTLIVVWHWRVV